MPTWEEVSLWLDARGEEAWEAGEEDLARCAYRLAVYATKQTETIQETDSAPPE